MFKLGQEKPHADVDQIMYVLENLERIYLIEVMTGSTWETTWTKQNAQAKEYLSAFIILQDILIMVVEPENTRETSKFRMSGVME